MNKYLLIFFLVFIFSIHKGLEAQIELISGYILTKEKDTLNGYLLNEVDSKLIKSIDFYSNTSDTNPRTYTTSEINGFVYSTGRTFKSVQKKGDSIPTFAKRVATGKINMFAGHEEVFGKFSIYLYRSDTALSVTLSQPQKIVVYSDDKTYNRKDKKYIGLITYITGNTKTDVKLNSLKYREKEIKKYIVSYNNEFEESFPSNSYTDIKKASYALTVGFPFNINLDNTHFRVSAYRDITYIEKSRTISFRIGMSYRYWKSNEDVNTDYQNGETLFRQQFLSIIPLGVNFHGNPKKIIPYGYIGLGLGIMYNSLHEIRKYELAGTDHELYFLPTLNIGSGIKIAVNTGYLIVEITPSVNTIFFNLGYAF